MGQNQDDTEGCLIKAGKANLGDSLVVIQQSGPRKTVAVFLCQEMEEVEYVPTTRCPSLVMIPNIARKAI